MGKIPIEITSTLTWSFGALGDYFFHFEKKKNGGWVNHSKRLQPLRVTGNGWATFSQGRKSGRPGHSEQHATVLGGSSHLEQPGKQIQIWLVGGRVLEGNAWRTEQQPPFPCSVVSSTEDTFLATAATGLCCAVYILPFFLSGMGVHKSSLGRGYIDHGSSPKSLANWCLEHVHPLSLQVCQCHN